MFYVDKQSTQFFSGAEFHILAPWQPDKASWLNKWKISESHINKNFLSHSTFTFKSIPIDTGH